MPNWCANKVTFKHTDTTKIKDIVRAWNSGEFMTFFCPCPKELLDTTAGAFGDALTQRELVARENLNLAEYGYKNWYDWRVSEWGTKWDVGREKNKKSLSVRSGAKQITITFESAWSPPIGFYEKMRDRYDYHIEAYFYEPGVGFCGSWRDGIEASFSLDNIRTVDDLRATVPSKIIAAFSIDDFVLQEIEDT